MDTMNVALPESMKQFVQQRVAEGRYSIVIEYISIMILADQKRKAEERIDALLLEGLGSGQPVPVTPEYYYAPPAGPMRSVSRRSSVSQTAGTD